MDKIAVFPCGSEIGLEIARSFQGIKNVKLVGISSVPNHGKFIYNDYIEIDGSVDDPNFISQFSNLIRENDIDFIFPAHDDVVLSFAQHFDTKTIGSPHKTCLITRYKSQTYRHFNKIIRTPKYCDMNYPLFIKPDKGQGSKGCHIVRNAKELKFYLTPEVLALEYLPGEEYTVECFTDYKGQLLYCAPRQRRRISNGISVNTNNVSLSPDIEAMANAINDNLTLNGAWFFQAKYSRTDELTLMEIAPRIGGSSGLSRIKGVNLPVLSYFNHLKQPVTVAPNEFNVELDRAWSNKYKLNIDYSHLYVDFDDCLYIDGKINSDLIKLIVQCRNEGKSIHLLSKHSGNLHEILLKLKIKDLFDTVVQMPKHTKKSYYINRTNSIFIDDSFEERQDVYKIIRIPVFAPDAIEGLL